jgi:uncharacterized BrkB/YihY/UPF0761 family membrane protein
LPVRHDAGRTLSKTITASCLAWQLPVKIKASVKVIGSVAGLLAGIALMAILANRIRAEVGVAAGGVSFLVVLAVYVVGWVVVMAALPRDTPDPGSLIPGAVLLALVLVGMQAVSQLYLPGRFSRASELYGAIGASLVVLGWFFIVGRTIVLALVVNAVMYERFGSISEFVFALPVVRILPRRSKRIRRFFGLDAVPPDAPPVPGGPSSSGDDQIT